jgi:hypothetical protein
VKNFKNLKKIKDMNQSPRRFRFELIWRISIICESFSFVAGREVAFPEMGFEKG